MNWYLQQNYKKAILIQNISKHNDLAYIIVNHKGDFISHCNKRNHYMANLIGQLSDDRKYVCIMKSRHTNPKPGDMMTLEEWNKMSFVENL